MKLELDALTDYDAQVVTTEPAEQAGVLVPIIERDGSHAILFTERSADLSTHAGEMSFPGGGWEDGDGDLVGTALREAHEEVGLDPDEAEVVGRLDDVPGPYGHVVRPIVARVADRKYVPTSGEVARVVVLPVAALADAANYSTEEWSDPDRGTATLPFFRVDGDTVWGLTGIILQTLLRLTAGWHPDG